MHFDFIPPSSFLGHLKISNIIGHCGHFGNSYYKAAFCIIWLQLAKRFLRRNRLHVIYLLPFYGPSDQSKRSVGIYFAALFPPPTPLPSNIFVKLGSNRNALKKKKKKRKRWSAITDNFCRFHRHLPIGSEGDFSVPYPAEDCRPVRSAKIQISLCVCVVWSESSLGAFRITNDAKFLHSDNEYSDQIAMMGKLTWVFVGRAHEKVLSSHCGLIYCQCITFPFSEAKSQFKTMVRMTTWL